MPAPTPLHSEPKTIFEWFQNVYYWYDVENSSSTHEDKLKVDVMQAWRRYRRDDPQILMTKDKGSILQWVKGDWEALRGRESVVGDISHFTDEEGAPEPADKIPEDTPPVVVKPVEEEVKEEEGDLDGDDEQVEVACKKQYFEEYWAHELDSPTSAWTVQDVREFILSQSRKAKPSSQPRQAAIARAAFESDIDGKLLEAGGVDLLIERTVGHVKWDASILRKESNHIMGALKQHKLKSAADYFQRSGRLQDIYHLSKLLPVLQAALQPVPFEEVLYTNICSRESSDACDVKGLDRDVCKRCTNKEYKFKVVCVTPHEEPLEVWHNLIYFKETSTWLLLASVDFMKHGEAPSGHWHLNRAPLGELIPHWGPSNSVFHGQPDSCPIWWQLIPKGMSYYSLPERNPLRSWIAK